MTWSGLLLLWAVIAFLGLALSWLVARFVG